MNDTTAAYTESPPRFLVLGYANHDVNRNPDGSEHRAVGGGGLFAALAASVVMSDIGFVTKVGADFDRSIFSGRIDTRAVRMIEDGVTATSIQTYHDAADLSNRSIELIPGVNPLIGPDDVPEEWLENARGVLLSTMAPEQHRRCAESLAKRRSSIEAPRLSIGGEVFGAPFLAVDSDLCWLQDPEHRRQVIEAMSIADIVFMNRAEGKILAEIIPKISLLVLKKDAEGAEVFVRGQKRAGCSAPTVEVVDATGAGDVLAGTFLASIIRGMPLDAALSTAVHSASLAVTKFGIDHLYTR